MWLQLILSKRHLN